MSVFGEGGRIAISDNMSDGKGRRIKSLILILQLCHVHRGRALETIRFYQSFVGEIRVFTVHLSAIQCVYEVYGSSVVVCFVHKNKNKCLFKYPWPLRFRAMARKIT